jgi:hypothetical protein
MHLVSASFPDDMPVAHYFPNNNILAGFFALWSGCMAGVWLSFGARKATFKFEDLHIPEQDRLAPVIRLFFVGLLTIILGFAFSVGAVAVNIGVGSEEARRSAGLRPPLKLHGRFSRPEF